MKTSAIAAVFAALGTAAFDDPVEGIWNTKTNDNDNYGHVEIKPCSPALCGTLVKALNGADKEIESDNIGRRIVWDMVAFAEGLYDDGGICSPDRDKEYNGDMSLAGDGLAVRGCVLGICRDGGSWKRVN
ncbi:MAG: DUF2147 domain-containing protein [Rhodobacter sp.]|nr:DUF2147 domain-containing protein [Rhodobacter sp.]